MIDDTQWAESWIRAQAERGAGTYPPDFERALREGTRGVCTQYPHHLLSPNFFWAFHHAHLDSARLSHPIGSA
jgi:hypothetical protein